jgi:hypothetical protein
MDGNPLLESSALLATGSCATSSALLRSESGNVTTTSWEKPCGSSHVDARCPEKSG